MPPFAEESPRGERLGALAVDLVALGRMHPRSRPHCLLGMSLTPLAALELDRAVLASARKWRAWQVNLDLVDPGEFGIAGILKLLGRLALEP